MGMSTKLSVLLSTAILWNSGRTQETKKESRSRESDRRYINISDWRSFPLLNRYVDQTISPIIFAFSLFEQALRM